MIGSIVRRKGYDIGAGVIVGVERQFGKIKVKVGWFSTPFIRFQTERKIGWHLYSSLFIISETTQE